MQEQWRSLVIEPPPWICEFRDTADRLTKFTVPILGEFKHHQQAMQPFWDALRKSSEEYERIEEAGWLPHDTTPSDVLEAEGLDAEGLDAAIAAYHQSQLSEVKEAFRARVGSYEIDDEAKQTFFATLGMHAAGFFKGTARLLFPEIERVARVELHGNAMDSIASQRALRASAVKREAMPIAAAETNPAEQVQP